MRYHRFYVFPLSFCFSLIFRVPDDGEKVDGSLNDPSRSLLD